MTKTLVIGSANNVLQDMAQVNLTDFDYIIAVNKAILMYPSATHWVTLHPERLPEWETELREPLPEECVVVSFDRKTNLLGCEIRYEVDDTLDYLFPNTCNSGSSGLFAVKYALERLNSDSVVLAGVPMDPILCHYSDSEFWSEGETFWDSWVQVKDLLIDRNVRSLSGRTSKLLGLPD